MSTQKTIIERRTINQFKPEPKPPRELIDQALEAARWAPNHRFTEPWRFYLLGSETVAQIIDLNTEIVAASKGEAAAKAKREKWSSVPGWLVVSCVKSDDPLTAQEDYAACACAIQNIQLSLWENGVGAKWTTGAVTRDPRFYDTLWIDRDLETVVGMVWYGYPEEIPVSRRKRVSEVLIELP